MEESRWTDGFGRPDESMAVATYNHELWHRFVTVSERGIRTAPLPEYKKYECSQSLDLIRAINSYRSYQTPQALFAAYPELLAQVEHVELLWSHFREMNSQELSELMIQMIHEVMD